MAILTIASPESWCVCFLVIGMYLHSYPQSWLTASAGFCPWLPLCSWGTCEQKRWSPWPPDDSTLSTGTDRRSSCRNGLRICRRRPGIWKKRAQEINWRLGNGPVKVWEGGPIVIGRWNRTYNGPKWQLALLKCDNYGLSVRKHCTLSYQIHTSQCVGNLHQ